MSPTLPEHIFRAYDIRGIVGEDLDEKIVERIGLGYGTMMAQEGRRRLAVGYDVRATSPLFADALSRGLCAAGIDVTLVGEVPTPVLYYSIAHWRLDGGIMVTGSHNPIQYNGLKICRDVWPIWGDEIRRLRDVALAARPAAKSGKLEKKAILPAYLAELGSKFKIRPGLRVAIDCGNGTAGPVIVPLLKQYRVELLPLYVEPDGTFPNHLPDPEVPEFMEDLARLVLSERADIGFGFDGDSDRVGLIDELGNRKSADHLLLVMARHLLLKVPGGKIIMDVKCSDFLLKDLAQRGGKPMLWKTGHSIIKEKMREEHAILAGELSGHICVAHEYYGFDDAFFAALLTLHILSESEPGKPPRSCSSLFADIPRTSYTPEVKIGVSEGEKFKVVAALVGHYKQKMGLDRVNDIDGVRATWDDGWALIRASNTTANLTVRVEGKTAEALKRIAGIVLESLRHHPVDTTSLLPWATGKTPVRGHGH